MEQHRLTCRNVLKRYERDCPKCFRAPDREKRLRELVQDCRKALGLDEPDGRKRLEVASALYAEMRAEFSDKVKANKISTPGQVAYHLGFAWEIAAEELCRSARCRWDCNTKLK